MQGRVIFMGALIAAFVGGQAFAQTAGRIGDSPHDLASGSAANADKNEICVYCHTPHGADNANGPLWNKPTGTAATAYSLYDSTTIDGTVLASVGNVSVACLTCHDGTQARDAVINAPGTGLGTSPLGGLGTMPVGAANLGTDLQNDHPIAIQYGGFDPGAGQIDPDFENDAGALEDNGALGADKRWWVDTGVANATRDKTDMILFTRLNGAASEPFVECATCHDPHSGVAADVAAGGTNAPGSDISFMRIANTDSDVCLACHIK